MRDFPLFSITDGRILTRGFVILLQFECKIYKEQTSDEREPLLSRRKREPLLSQLTFKVLWRIFSVLVF
jgi:hypothetical protein